MKVRNKVSFFNFDLYWKFAVCLFLDQVDKIKLAMRNISVAPVHVPEWAKVIPEDQWKDRLFSHLQTNIKSNSDDKNSKSRKDSCDKLNSSWRFCSYSSKIVIVYVCIVYTAVYVIVFNMYKVQHGIPSPYFFL